MLRPADLAARPDFEAGVLLVSPSRRIVRGPQGEIHLEPRIMQVFLLLLDAGGRVVTRNEIFDQCWGGAMVGDDSLNRAVGKVRKTTGEVAPGAMEIETIPRTGYRVTGEIPDRYEPVEESAGISRGLSRRAVVGSAAAAALAVGLGAERILFVSDVPGVYLDGAVAHTLAVGEADRLLDAGELAGGIVPKVRAAVVAARLGVRAEIGATAVVA